MELFPVIKKNKSLAEKWMQVEIITLSKLRPSKKDKWLVLSPSLAPGLYRYIKSCMYRSRESRNKAAQGDKVDHREGEDREGRDRLRVRCVPSGKLLHVTYYKIN